MELRQLKYFVAVVEWSSFSLAAGHLNVTQPALSKSLRSLEQSLGAKLLERGPNGVSLTTYGEQLFLYARPILSMVAEAKDEIASMRGAGKGRLHIGAIPSSLRVLVPATVTDFLHSRGNVRLTIQEGLSDTIVNAVRSGTLDLAVTVLPAENFSDEVNYRVLQEEPMRVVCRPGHPLLQSPSPRLSDLDGYEWVVPDRHEPDRRQLDSLFALKRLPAPRIAMETTSVTLLSTVLGNADYLSYLPASSVSNTKDLVMAPLDDLIWMRTTVVAFRDKAPLRPLLTQFIRALEEVAERLSRWAS